MNAELNPDACRKRAAPSALGDDNTVGLLRSIETALEGRFGDTLSPHERNELACNARAEFTDSPVTNYLPILVERRAIQLAAAYAASEPVTPPSTR